MTPASNTRGQAVRPLVYRLDWTDANSHLFDVTIRFTARQALTELMLPAWRPGRYLIQNYAANVRNWSARSDRGALAITKSDKSTWQVVARRGERVEVSYQFFAAVLDAGSSFLDENEAYFNGSNLFMLVDGRRRDPVTLELRVPRGWKVATQLRRIAAGTFEARDYDHLIDSPTIISPSLATEEIRVAGKRVALTFHDPRDLDLATLAGAIRPALEEQVAVFGELPSKRYAFLYHLGTVWHGVEHEDSSSIILKEWELANARAGERGFDLFLEISSHEFFHLWNVKRILPAVFAPYDYAHETPTRLLWLMEGVTSYYAALTIVRSGTWSTSRYLEHLATEITTLENAPGREILSLSQASFDGWLQDPAHMHDKANAWISFYNKGEIAGALLDLYIRSETRGRRSLDDVMRALWREFGKRGRGIPEDALPDVIARVTKRDVGSFFEQYIDGVTPLPYEELFSRAGVEFKSERDDAVGVDIDARFVITRLDRFSALAVAGLAAGDELIAVDDHRIATAEQLKKLLIARDGAKCCVTFARRGRVEQREFTMRKSFTVRCTLSARSDASDGEKRLRAAWLKEVQ